MTAPVSIVPLVAVAGNPNAGKSALFNALTGARQKIGNYPGVTVERRTGRMTLAGGRAIDLVDLPGSYSLTPASPDEAVTRRALLGEQEGLPAPDAVLVVVDAGNLAHQLRFTLELLALGRPVVIALNMIDLAERDGLTLAPERLAQALGVPVIPTVAVRRRGLEELKVAIADALDAGALPLTSATGGAGPDDLLIPDAATAPATPIDDAAASKARTVRAREIAAQTLLSETRTRQTTRAIDAVLLHPVAGLLILLSLMFLMFQAVFAWSEAPIGWIDSGMAMLTDWVGGLLPAGLLRSFLTDGVIAGVGSVVVFLPQILILFFFILLLESTGYMTRAAYVMDRMMAAVGLSGHSFIPLLSSFACAVPGIMATRSIADERDRLTTILVAPLMTCSARLPVYTVIIGAFIPARSVGPGVGLQGLTMFGLYLFGIVGAMLAALVIRRRITRGPGGSFLIEMPRYQLPRPADIALGLWQRTLIFLKRAGTIIFVSSVILWAMLSFPQTPDARAMPQSEYSVAGRIASVLEVVVRPIGFNQDIALALIPAMAAREVAVSALATANAIDASDEEAAAAALGDRLASRWSLATALAFLTWFVFAPQCISTIAVARRETNSWRWPALMVGYLFALAYGAAGAVYWIAVALGLG